MHELRIFGLYEATVGPHDVRINHAWLCKATITPAQAMIISKGKFFLSEASKTQEF